MGVYYYIFILYFGRVCFVNKFWELYFRVKVIFMLICSVWDFGYYFKFVYFYFLMCVFFYVILVVFSVFLFLKNFFGDIFLECSIYIIILVFIYIFGGLLLDFFRKLKGIWI